MCHLVDSISVFMAVLLAPEEVELAERLIDMHDFADMAKFARTGAEANCIGLRAARLATGKEKIVKSIKFYFSFI
mgnify:CR=1 FL=1